jgi:hypothetical protein
MELFAMAVDRLENIVSLSKRRGFVFPSSEIYGGLRASWDYGPLGVELKNNVKRQWWKSMVMGREDVVSTHQLFWLAKSGKHQDTLQHLAIRLPNVLLVISVTAQTI